MPMRGQSAGRRGSQGGIQRESAQEQKVCQWLQLAGFRPSPGPIGLLSLHSTCNLGGSREAGLGSSAVPSTQNISPGPNTKFRHHSGIHLFPQLGRTDSVTEDGAAMLREPQFSTTAPPTLPPVLIQWIQIWRWEEGSASINEEGLPRGGGTQTGGVLNKQVFVWGTLGVEGV